MKSIHTLIPDIYQLLNDKSSGWMDDAVAQSFGLEVSSRLQEKYGQTGERQPTLRLSQMGPKCPCALWYSIHHPELAEKMPPWAEFKYSYGHMIEGLVIALAKAAGHQVEGEQDELELDGIVGHRDCIIDGCLLDVKSASSYSFKKFQDKSIKDNDPFGYLSQLDGYLCASRDDPKLTVKDRGYLLAIDKTLGHMALYEHEFTQERRVSLRRRISEYKEIVVQTRPPRCACETVPHGKSGNIKLGVKASYSPQKYCCFPELRTFIYADGPVYLTHVAKKPDVLEVDKYGKPVFIH